MGIRYYAYPVASDGIDDARRDPYRFLGSDPLMDAWGARESRPRMLYLDKCWRCLQSLFGVGTERERTALELVRGDVTFKGLGWIGFTRVLDPLLVAAIASDLEAFAADGQSTFDCRFDGEIDYVRDYLSDATEFTRSLADRGEGLVYLIG